MRDWRASFLWVLELWVGGVKKKPPCAGGLNISVFAIYYLSFLSLNLRRHGRYSPILRCLCNFS